MTNKNLTHIRARFEAGTGTALPRRRPVMPVLPVLALLLLCLTTAAVAAGLFSSLDGDDLALSSVYEGNGVVSVMVENRSEKPLRLQNAAKLMRWSTGEELGVITLDSITVPDGESRTFSVVLNDAADVAALEEPLPADDWYYLVFTGDRFLFGQDWQCSLHLSREAQAVAQAAAESAQETKQELRGFSLPAAETEGVLEIFGFYYDETPTEDRETLDRRYLEAWETLAQQYGDRLVSTAPNGLLLGEPENCPLPTGLHDTGRDFDRRYLTEPGGEALVLYADLPLSTYPDAYAEMPLFYLFCYDAAQAKPGRYLLCRGRLLDFGELAGHEVYRDGEIVCYNLSELFYNDLDAQLDRFASTRPDVTVTEEVRSAVRAMRDRYTEQMAELFCYAG